MLSEHDTRLQTMNAPKRLCALTEPASHVDACLCDATTWRDKCNMPDFTCRERALIAGSGPQTVQKAHEYDARQTTSLFQHLRQKANCKTVRRRCPIKIAQLPVSAAADTDRDDGHATGDTSRNDCEIAQKVRLMCRHIGPTKFSSGRLGPTA